MKTNNEQTPETSCISNTPHSTEHNISIMCHNEMSKATEHEQSILRDETHVCRGKDARHTAPRSVGMRLLRHVHARGDVWKSTDSTRL
jgi:hypothetical protein